MQTFLLNFSLNEIDELLDFNVQYFIYIRDHFQIIITTLCSEKSL